MTTQSWSTPIDHTSDAGFRTWGAELQAKFVAAGLVQSADTGQINWSTVTRPATSTDAGYEIYYLNDSLFATAPIYIKILYGTNGSANGPRLKLQIGTSTNGSGTLTGTTTTALQTSLSGTPASTSTSYQSYLCVAAGFVGLIFKSNAISGGGCSIGGFCICRSCDSSGAISPTGAFLYICSANSAINAVASNQSVRFASTAAVYTSSTNHAAVVPGAEISSTVGSDTQAYLFWMLTKQLAPVFGMAVAYLTEISEGSTFSATLVGTTSHTYIQTGHQLGTGWFASVGGGQGMCMLWE